jgi:hypothetical protein
MANLNITHLVNVGRNNQEAPVSLEGGTVAFDKVIIDGTKRDVSVNASARVIRLEPEADCHFLKGSSVSSSDVSTSNEILKAGQVYHKQVDGDETIAVVQT